MVGQSEDNAESADKEMNEASKKTEKADDATNEDSKDEPEYILCKSCHEKE